MMLWLLATALGAEAPCYGHLAENQRDSDHFWVEWSGDDLADEEAATLLEAAEASRGIYLDKGWPMTDRPVVFLVRREDGGGISGLAQTIDCAGDPVPQVNLTVRRFSEESAYDVVSHELGHVAQYGYMGDHLDSVASWLWWMEGSASWMETLVTDNVGEWKSTALDYLDEPQIALHQGPPAWLDADRTDHMYGTVVLATFLEQRYGGPDTMRKLWEWGGEHTGEPLNLLDGLDGIGLDGREVWHHWMATAPVVDLEVAPRRGARRAVDVGVLPNSDTPTDRLPEGFGLGVVHFAASTGVEGQDLEVRFTGDSWADWAVVLATSSGADPGSALVDYTVVPIEQGTGVGRIWFDGSADAWLVVSPLERSLETYHYAWEATLVTSIDGDPAQEAVSCDTLRGPWSWGWLLLLGPWVRRRR